MKTFRQPILEEIGSRLATTDKDGLASNVFFDKNKKGTIYATKRAGLTSYQSANGLAEGIFGWNNTLYMFQEPYILWDDFSTSTTKVVGVNYNPKLTTPTSGVYTLGLPLATSSTLNTASAGLVIDEPVGKFLNQSCQCSTALLGSSSIESGITFTMPYTYDSQYGPYYQFHLHAYDSLGNRSIGFTVIISTTSGFEIDSRTGTGAGNLYVLADFSSLLGTTVTVKATYIGGVASFYLNNTVVCTDTYTGDPTAFPYFEPYLSYSATNPNPITVKSIYFKAI